MLFSTKGFETFFTKKVNLNFESKFRERELIREVWVFCKFKFNMLKEAKMMHAKEKLHKFNFYFLQ